VSAAAAASAVTTTVPIAGTISAHLVAEAIMIVIGAIVFALNVKNAVDKLRSSLGIRCDCCFIRHKTWRRHKNSLNRTTHRKC